MAAPRGAPNTGVGRAAVYKTDVVRAEYSFNGGTTWSVIGRLMGNETNGTNNAGEWRQDANLNNSAADDRIAATPSQFLTQTFQDFTFPIPATGASLLVRMVVESRGSFNTEMAFDNIRVTGDAATVATPTLASIENTPATFTEGGAAVQLTNTLVAANPASGRSNSLTKATVRFVAGYIPGEDQILYPNPNFSFNFIQNTATLTITVAAGRTATLSEFQAALRTLQYTNTNTTNARAGDRTFDFVVYDNPSGTDIASNVQSRTVQVNSVLNNPACLPYTDDFETDGEGTRYASTAYTASNNLGFFRTSATAPATPFPLGGSTNPYTTSTFSGYSGSVYWFSTTTSAPSNPNVPINRLVTAPVNATDYHDLHFLLKMGQGTNSQGWEPSDYVKLSYRLSSTGAWVDFASFYGLGTTGQIRQDTNNDGVADAAGLQLNAPLKDFDFTLPPALTGGSISFKIEFSTSSTDEEFAFDHLRVTGLNNYAPTDIALSPSTVAENQPAGTVVGTFSSTDPDNPAQGQTFTYTLVSGANSTDNASFTMGTGANAGRLLTASAFDFEAKSSYSIRVRTTDNGSTPLSVEKSFTITVTNVNEAPVIAIQTFSLAENSATNTVVGTVAATDPDAGQTLTYAITAGNTGGAFAINSSSGQLTVANPAALNFEVTPTFALTVSVSDGTLASTATITVNLTDAPNATYLSSTAEQNTRGVLAGATDQVILRIPVVLDGSVDEPLSATGFTFGTAGTTAPADVAAARLYVGGHERHLCHHYAIWQRHGPGRRRHHQRQPGAATHYQLLLAGVRRGRYSCHRQPARCHALGYHCGRGEPHANGDGPGWGPHGGFPGQGGGLGPAPQRHQHRLREPGHEQPQPAAGQ